MVDFKLSDEIIAKDIFLADKNRIKFFQDVNLTTYPSTVFAVTLQHIAEKETANFLNELGQKMGLTAAKEMMNELLKKKSFIPERLQSIFSLLQSMGLGKIEILEEKDDNKIYFRVTNNPIIEYAKEKFGNKSVICNFFGEFYLSYINIEVQFESKKLKHNKCICKGDPYCEWST